MQRYNHKKIESRWQKFWAKRPNLYSAKEKGGGAKAYILDMFPYPSAEGLHTGHVESYTATDIVARYFRMKGKNVLHPQGFDAFGLPAENFAVKTKTHPSITTQRAISNFRQQMKMMGLSYDWSRMVDSSDPEYYKWTQWFFLLLYKNGLAYRGKAKVNWCPKCQTVLANEQAEGGVCERCGTPVLQKDLEQWFFKITDFIEDRGKTSGLISGLDKIDWPESTKAGQRNWIGKSEGAQFKMRIENSDLAIEVFTTRLDTVFGMTFALIAPEHEIISKIKKQILNINEVEKYIEAAKKKSELQRMAEEKEKTGVELKGVKVINPFTKEAIPLFVSDFILGHYGTGAVMAVPAHDQRDFDFAKKYHLPIKMVICPNYPEPRCPVLDKAYEEDGHLVDSGEFTGLSSFEARKKLTQWLEKNNLGSRKVNYKMRDWLISRQRYWGAPIPIIYCEKCVSKKPNFLFFHCYKGSSKGDFWPWLKSEIEKRGFGISVPDLPGNEHPKFEEQAEFIINNFNIDENTVIVTHSLGGALALKLLSSGKFKTNKLVLVAPASTPNFKDKKRPGVENFCDWKFNYTKIKNSVGEITILSDKNDPIIKIEDTKRLTNKLGARLIETELLAPQRHFNCAKADVILENVLSADILNPGMHSVPEKDLPVLLPDDVDFMPTGESPLARSKKFHDVKCPKCGEKARRESDTMDTFVCSSWYYFRYADPRNKKEFVSKKQIKKWLPVDLYVGGAEHTVLHLLYSRFFTKVLHSLGYIDFDEPFSKMRHQGIIVAQDGRKMSKSLGNVVNPNDVVAKYGADALRLFEMFMGPLEDSKKWDTKGIMGVYRFLEKTWDCIFRNHMGLFFFDEDRADWINGKFQGDTPIEVKILLNKTIKKVTEDIENLRFNTAISQLMILRNSFYRVEEEEAEQHLVGNTKVGVSGISGRIISKSDFKKFLILLAPFAPHIAEELWTQLGSKKSIFAEKWPEYDPALVKDEIITLIVQINGKVRAKISAPADISEEKARNISLSDSDIKKWLGGKAPKKVIFARGRLVNIVI